MPSQVNLRAEQVLLKISGDLRDIQMQAFSLQDKLAEKINIGYNDSWKNAIKKPGLDILGSAVIFWFSRNPTNLMQALNIAVQVDPQEQEKAKARAIDFLNTGLNHATSLLTGPSGVSTSASLQKYDAQKNELLTVNQLLTSAIQTHEQAVQRLQGQEGANRQAG
jgi:hypothetical protein